MADFQNDNAMFNKLEFKYRCTNTIPSRDLKTSVCTITPLLTTQIITDALPSTCTDSEKAEQKNVTCDSLFHLYIRLPIF